MISLPVFTNSLIIHYVFTKKKQNTKHYKDISRFMPPIPLTKQVTKNLNLTRIVKIFNLKQKRKKSNTSRCYRKNEVLHLQENSLVFLKSITSSLL